MWGRIKDIFPHMFNHLHTSFADRTYQKKWALATECYRPSQGRFWYDSGKESRKRHMYSHKYMRVHVPTYIPRDPWSRIWPRSQWKRPKHSEYLHIWQVLHGRLELGRDKKVYLDINMSWSITFSKIFAHQDTWSIILLYFCIWCSRILSGAHEIHSLLPSLTCSYKLCFAATHGNASPSRWPAGDSASIQRHSETSGSRSLISMYCFRNHYTQPLAPISRVTIRN